MQLTKGLRLAFLALLALHLVSAFAAIGLLGRMKPAIKRVIQQNVYSLEAVEAMLGELAKGELGEEEHFAAALERAQDNITNEREAPLVAQVRDRMGDVFVGDVQARALVVTDLRELAELNRADIVAANQEAKRLGSAGAWAVAILAFLTLVAGLVALRRLDRRVLLPLEELHDVLLAVRRGEPRRRCQPMNVAASELARSMAMINRLIDDRSEALATASVAEHMALVGLEDDDRATLLHLLARDA